MKKQTKMSIGSAIFLLFATSTFLIAEYFYSGKIQELKDYISFLNTRRKMTHHNIQGCNEDYEKGLPSNKIDGKFLISGTHGYQDISYTKFNV